MKKAIAGILTLGGAILLVIGIIGLFGTNVVQGNPWMFAILGLVFFIAGISLFRSITTIERSDGV